MNELRAHRLLSCQREMQLFPISGNENLIAPLTLQMLFMLLVLVPLFKKGNKILPFSPGNALVTMETVMSRKWAELNVLPQRLTAVPEPQLQDLALPACLLEVVVCVSCN